MMGLATDEMKRQVAAPKNLCPEIAVHPAMVRDVPIGAECL